MVPLTQDHSSRLTFFTTVAKNAPKKVNANCSKIRILFLYFIIIIIIILASVISAFICFNNVIPNSKKYQPASKSGKMKKKESLYDDLTQIYIVVSAWRDMSHAMWARGEVWTK